MTLRDVPVVRRARAGDEEGIARVHVDSWREAYAGIIPADYLASLSYADRQAMWQRVLGLDAAHQVVFLAEDPKAGIVGFASGGVAPAADSPRVGEIMTLYLLRAWQGRGLGRELFASVVHGLRDLGAEGLTLWVLADNLSRGFYGRMGGRAGRSQAISLGGADIAEVEYRWDHLPDAVAGDTGT